MKSYVFNHLIAFDQWLNVLLGGDPDESLSSRAHRMRLKKHKYWGWLANAIDGLFFWEKNHCENSYISEIERFQSKAIKEMI